MPVIRPALYLWMILILTACNLAETATTPIQPSPPSDTPHLVTAWAEGGNLYVWQTGDSFARRVASGGVIQPFVSPDGVRIAFTRGPAGAPDSLWMVSTDGALEQQLVGDGKPATYREAQMGQVVWWDATTLYFNTLKRAVPASTPQHDLYRANVVTRAISMLLGPGEGGRISLSPKREKIALVSAGDYGKHNGRIRVIVDPLAQQPSVDLLFFTGIATGAHSGFYPPITWTDDESALLAAIPDQDLLYSEDEAADVPETVIWHLPIETPSDRKTVGTIPASFFGMPRWSDDGTQMLYLTRTDTDTFQIMLADATGENAVDIDAGKTGEIDMPTWISGTHQFFYSKGKAGNLLIGARDELVHPLRDETILAPNFVTATQFVFMAPQDSAYQLRSAVSDQPALTIGELAGLVVFDAVWVD